MKYKANSLIGVISRDAHDPIHQLIDKSYTIQSCSGNTTIAYLESNGVNAVKKISKDNCTYFINGYVLDIENLHDKRLEDVEGEFVIVKESDASVTIINDRFASRPFFIMADEERFIFSNSIDSIVRLTEHKKFDLNDEAIFSMLAYGHIIKSETLFKSIFLVEPGMKYEIDKQTLQVSKLTYYSLSYKESDASSEDKAKELFKSFYNAFSKRLAIFSKHDKPIIQLSGGLDSRLMVGCLETNDSRALIYTLANYDQKDLEVAQEITNILSLEHEVGNISCDNYIESSSDLTQLMSGIAISSAAYTNLPLYQLFQDKSPIIFGAWSGDVLAGEYIPNHNMYLNEKYKKKAIEKFFDKRCLEKYYLKKVLKEGSFNNLKFNIKTHLLNTTMKFNAKTAAQAITLWAMQVRQPHFSFLSPAHFISDVAEVSPCLGYDYCDNLLTLSSEELVNKNIYKYMIFNNFPKLKKVIYANTGELLDGDFKFPVFSNQSLLSKSFVKEIIPNTLKPHLKKLLNTNSASDFDKVILTTELMTEFKNKIELISGYSEILDFSKILSFVLSLEKNDFNSREENQLFQNLETVVNAIYHYRDRIHQ